ncbi:MAG: hypothetical protein CM1200mP34_2380 [Verrucomicrobiales bacterium]|nr:MAG: hypothetical protein CM1200mP34_2380 [Verrucomicrobiales bacterium]
MEQGDGRALKIYDAIGSTSVHARPLPEFYDYEYVLCLAA